MNNFNNTLTIEEARVILSNRANFVNTPHNRKMIAEATHEILVKIQNKQYMTYYFSKWRKEWVEFKNQPPSEGELIQMRKLNYQIKQL